MDKIGEKALFREEKKKFEKYEKTCWQMEGAVVSYQSCPRDSGFQIKSELEWENKKPPDGAKKVLDKRTEMW